MISLALPTEAGLNVVSFLASMLEEDTSSYAKDVRQKLGEFNLGNIGVYDLSICLWYMILAHALK